MKNTTRTNVRKTYLNDTEDGNFSRACAIAKTTAGKQTRILINDWTEVQLANDRRRKGRNEGPTLPINRAFIFPGRVNYGAAPQMRMRM